MNKVILIGNLTRDPELTTTSGGISLCKFSIAVGRKHENANGERETDFFNVIAWRGLAENCAKWLMKGKKAAVVGSVQNRSYEAQDGSKRYITEIMADEVEFLSPNQKNDDNGSLPPPPRTPAKTNGGQVGFDELEPVSDDDLPF